MIDVRSPGEYAYGHMPGAINIPLFSDEERAKVGTLYKKTGKEAAIALGLEFVDPKKEDFLKEALCYSDSSEFLVHCWRGGMRSAGMAKHFNENGLKAHTLSNGYKAYRHAVLDSFNTKLKIFVLGGETGSGKTEILSHLKKMGEQVIDLEGLAHHKGSSFGALGEKPQPSTEQFENNLFELWSKVDPGRRVWLEDESHTIGSVYLADSIWQQMKAAPIIRVHVSKEQRIERLVKDYGNFDRQLLAEAIHRITRRLGPQHAKEALTQLELGNLATVADITLTYYDKAYNHNHEKRSFENIHFVDCDTADAEANAEKVMSFVITHL